MSERDDDREHDDEHDDDRDPGHGGAETLEAANERLAALERELGETRRESVKRRERVKALEGDLAREREQGLGDAERAVEQARREERERLEGEHRVERVRNAVLLAATSKLRDPADALRYVDLEALAALEGGEVEQAASRAVDDLLTDKAYLAVDANGDSQAGPSTPGPRSRQPTTTRSREGADMNARLRRRLRH